MASWFLSGVCLNTCNSPAICACCTGGADPPQSHCEGILAMRIESGRYDDIDLAGLTWMVAARWPGSVFGGHGAMAMYVDQSATAAQRAVLTTILSGEAGSAALEILNAVVGARTGPEFVSMHFEADLARRRGHLIIPGQVNVTIEPLTARLTGAEQRVTVRVPGAQVLREMEIARTSRMQVSGPITLQCRNSHAALGRAQFGNQELIT